ncbi:MAG: hypothetical protein ACKPKO_26310, partial [Candidatus Fonsibacter sp.]
MWNGGLHDSQFPTGFGESIDKSLADLFCEMLNLINDTKAIAILFQEPSLSSLAVSMLFVTV